MMTDLLSDSVFFLLMTPSIISIGSLLYVIWRIGKEQQSECSIKQMTTTEFMEQIKDQMRRREILVRLGTTVYSIVDSSDEEGFDKEGDEDQDDEDEGDEGDEGDEDDVKEGDEEGSDDGNEVQDQKENDEQIHNEESLLTSSKKEEVRSQEIKINPLPTNPFVTTIKTK